MKKKEWTQINEIRNERGEITTNATETKNHRQILWTVICQQKLDNLEEMDKFVETYSLPKLSQEETDNLKRLLNKSEIESEKKNPTWKLKSRSEWLHWGVLSNIWRTFTNLVKLCQKIEEEGKLSNSFQEATITLILKADKDITKKEKYRPIAFMNINAKILNKILAKFLNKIYSNPRTYKKDQKPWSSWIHSRVTRMVQDMQINQCDTPH